MIVFSGKFPWKPPSVNSMWRSFRGRNILSKESREYKDNVAQFAALQFSGKLRTEHLRAHIIHSFGDKRRRDATNYHKALLDALEGIIYVDDRQLVDVRLQILFGKEYYSEIRIYDDVAEVGFEPTTSRL